jgi:MoxR-like ATPase
MKSKEQEEKSPVIEKVDDCREIARAIKQEIGKALVGQEEVVRQVLVAFLSAGHIIVEGLPGLGKTLLIRALAKTFKGDAARIQFTPDLMPSDITGHVMYDVKSGQFEVRRGPVFTNLLIADELNRAPAKTQAALLEVMQENQVSIDGNTLKISSPFMTMATQNPYEHEGTYPLPDAQLDRFLLKIYIQYPEQQEEVDLIKRVTTNHVGDDFVLDDVATVTTIQTIMKIQQFTCRIQVDERIVDYAVRLVRATRDWPGISTGAGPRGSLALIRAARAQAMLEGRDFVTPDDIKSLVLPTLRHRLSLSPEVEIEGQKPDDILPQIMETIDVPRT